MDARRYAEEVVDPTIAEFEADPLSTRRAFLACVVTFHMVDYIAHPRKVTSLRRAFRQESPAFDTVDRVAHAFKHKETSDPTLKSLSADQVIERPPAVWGTAVWGLSRYDDATGGATIANERQIDVLTSVKEAALFLKSKARS